MDASTAASPNLLSGAENQKAHSGGEGNGGDAHYQVHLALPDLRQELKIQASEF